MRITELERERERRRSEEGRPSIITCSLRSPSPPLLLPLSLSPHLSLFIFLAPISLSARCLLSRLAAGLYDPVCWPRTLFFLTLSPQPLHVKVTMLYSEDDRVQTNQEAVLLKVKVAEQQRHKRAEQRWIRA